MSFSKDFDEIFNQILTDYKSYPFRNAAGEFIQPDISQGSLIHMRSACLASALWGFYKALEYESRQIFPDTADTARLEHHAWELGLSRTVGESDASLLERVLFELRHPPAGGNKYDYIRWARSMDNVAAAWCFPIASGPGTVDVVILANAANTGSEIPSTHADLTGSSTEVDELKLIDAAAGFIADEVTMGDKVINETNGKAARVTSVDSETQLGVSADIFLEVGQAYRIVSLCREVQTYIDQVRPVGKYSSASVLPPTVVLQDVSLTATGSGLDRTAIAAEIAAYLSTFVPQQTLYLAKLVQIGMQAGAENIVVVTPAADVTPANYGMIRPGNIDVA